MRVIKPSENNGGIRIRFTLQGRKYNLSLKGKRWTNAGHYAQAMAIAARITADIEADRLDPSLISYQTAPAPLPNIPAALSELEIWDMWVSSLQLPVHTLNNHYAVVRSAIARGDLFRSDLSAYTHNLQRLFLNNAYEWAIEQNLTTKNPYGKVCYRKAQKQPVQVFKPHEISVALKAIEKIAPWYNPFTEALIVSGCRFSEAAGITWCSVDLDSASVTIDKALVRDKKTDRPYLKPYTKNRLVRVLQSRQLVDILCKSSTPRKPGQMVFTAPKGGYIRYGNYRKRVWERALNLADVPYRSIHKLRHTAISIALRHPDIEVPDAAYLAGHVDSTMVLKTYGHIIDRPKLPEIPL